MKARFKIVKKPWRGTFKYTIYRKHFFGLIWLPVHHAWDQLAAEQAIEFMKHRAEHLKKKPEVVGYY